MFFGCLSSIFRSGWGATEGKYYLNQGGLSLLFLINRGLRLLS
jgi:hypothetical protein